MFKARYILAIDPDCEKSGVAFLDAETKEMKCTCLPFPILLDYLQKIKRWTQEDKLHVAIYVEAGWLITHNWHVNAKDNRRTASAKGNSAGRNHEVGRKIVEMCKHYGFSEVNEVRPLKKCWKGKDGKITHAEIASFIPAFPEKSNQEIRDSALISWYFAGLPIKLNIVNKR